MFFVFMIFRGSSSNRHIELLSFGVFVFTISWGVLSTCRSNWRVVELLSFRFYDFTGKSFQQVNRLSELLSFFVFMGNFFERVDRVGEFLSFLSFFRFLRFSGELL